MKKVSNLPTYAAKTGYLILSSVLVVLGISYAAGIWNSRSRDLYTGIALILFGAVKLLGFFSGDLYRLAFQFDLETGAVILLLGISAVRHGEISFAGIGAVMVLDGILRIIMSVQCRDFGIEKWGVIASAAVLCTVLGCAVILSSRADAGPVTGIALIAEGLLNGITVLLAVKIVDNQLPDDNNGHRFRGWSFSR